MYNVAIYFVIIPAHQLSSMSQKSSFVYIIYKENKRRLMSMAIIKVTLDTEKFTAKPSGNTTGKIQSRFKADYDKYITEMTPLELLYAVGRHGRSWKPAIFNGEGTGNAHFKELHVLGIDIDDVDDWTITDTINTLNAYSLDYTGIYKTFSYQDNKQKHRIIFELPAIVNDKRLVTLLYLLFMEVLPADKQCKDPARLFFGGNNEPIVGTNKPLDLGNLYYAFCDKMSNLSSSNKTKKLKEIGSKCGINIVNGQLDIEISELDERVANNFSSTVIPYLYIKNYCEAEKSCHLLFPNFQLSSLQYKTRGRRTSVYEDVAKSYSPISETLNYGTEQIDINKLANSCHLLDDVLYGGYWAYHNELRLLSYNIHPIKGAVKSIINSMIFNSHGDTSYVHRIKNLVNTAIKNEYIPENCSSDNCPHYSDCSIINKGYKNLNNYYTDEKLKHVHFIEDVWDLEDKFGQVPQDIAELIGFPEKVELKTIEKDFKTAFDNYFTSLSKENNSNSLILLKAPTGLGKTEALINSNWDKFNGKRVAIAVPTHKLKDELAERFMNKGLMVATKPEKVLIKDEQSEKHIQNLFEIGHSKASLLYHKHLNDNITIPEYSNYLNQFEQFKQADIVITTHADILLNKADNYDTIIVDEDILLSSLETGVVSIKSIKAGLLLLQDELDFDVPLINTMLEFINDDNSIVLDLKYSENVMKRQLMDIENIVENSTLDTNLLKFISSEYIVKEKNYKGEFIYYGKRRALPNCPIMVLSASALNEVYQRTYYLERNVIFHDLNIVKDSGNLLQDLTLSFSRTNFTNKGVEAMEHIKDLLQTLGKNAKDYTVLTFKSAIDNFKEAGFNVVEDIYFGNTTGYDTLNGKNLIVAGTPHIPSGNIKIASLLLFHHMFNNQSIEIAEEMKTQKRYQINGVLIRFPSYDNCYIRLTQFYLVQTELLQAVGRARLNRNKNNEVLLFSNFPLQETHSFYMDKKCIKG